MLRSLIFYLVLGSLLTSCTANAPVVSSPPPATPSISPIPTTTATVCPQTQPIWAKPPEDSAVQDAPQYGYYFVNEDRSMWAAAWWAEPAASPLRISADGIKVGWFRPAGAALEITGQRIDAQAPPLEAHIPCCYPTRFQATGLIFPTAGCWKVTATAADRALSFVVRVEP